MNYSSEALITYTTHTQSSSGAQAYRGPQHGSVQVGGLLDADLEAGEGEALPGLRGDERGAETPSHDGSGELVFCSVARD